VMQIENNMSMRWECHKDQNEVAFLLVSQ